MKQENETGVNVFALPAEELRQLMKDHAASAQKCIDEITSKLGEAQDGRDAPVQSQREVYVEAIASLERRRDETIYLADHLAPGDHRMSAAEVLAFKRGFGELKVDIDRLKWAPQAAAAPGTQAERRLGDTMIKVPRLVLPTGALVE